MHPSQQQDLDYAIGQLARSGRGKSAMRQVLAWMDNDGLSLDHLNQEAIVMLIQLCWSQPMATRDAMREACQ